MFKQLNQAKSKLSFPFIQQLGMMECGTTCLAMILKYHGFYNIQTFLSEYAGVSTDGIDLYTLSEIAEELGFTADAYEMEWKYLQEITLPCIAHFEGWHFVVIYKATADEVWVADPAFGKIKYAKEDFLKKWNGITLVLEPTEKKFKNQDILDKIEENQAKHGSLWKDFYKPILQPFKKVIGEILMASFVLQVLGLAVPFFTQIILDNVLVNENKKLLFGILLGMGGIFLTQVLLLYARNLLLVQFKVEFELAFFGKFFDHFINLKQRFYDRHKREDFISRFRENLKIRQMADPNIVQNFIDLLFIVGYIPVLFLYNSTLGFIALGFTFLFFFFTFWFTPRIYRLGIKSFYKNIEAFSSFLDTLLGMTSIKLLGLEKMKYWKWKNKYKKSLNVVLDNEKTQIFLSSILKALYFCGQVTILWVGAWLTFEGEMTIGQYLAFVAIFMIIMNALNNVSNFWMMLTQISVSFLRLNDVLIQDRESENAIELKRNIRADKIEVQDLSFKYHPSDERNVLEKLSVTIESGQHIGIVGRNGTGKTTFVKLLVKLYQDYEGKILFGGSEMRALHPQTLRKKVFLFPQQIYIFNGTLRENILYGNPAATMEDVIAAAKLADLHDYVKDQYLGYNHKVGENGSNLSGGQALKIGFARLFLSKADVIILDEASSMLDIETEMKIMKNVKEQFKEKIIISIAHRVYTLRDTDRILVFDGGGIVEDGNHETLMASEGLYHTFMKTYVEY